MKLLLVNGNAVEIPLADESVHCVVTSPPYWGLRDYGIGDQLGLEPTPEQYIENMVAVFREVKRVLRADGTLPRADVPLDIRLADGVRLLGLEQSTD